MKPDPATIASVLSARFGGAWKVRDAHASAFASSWIAESDERLFVKTVELANQHVLSAEADGLVALRDTQTIRVPAVIGCWQEMSLAVLALEWLEFSNKQNRSGAAFGDALGALHAQLPQGEGHFGWQRDNMLGSTPQPNTWSEHTSTAGWIEFLRRNRFGHLRGLLAKGGSPAALIDAIDRVLEALPRCFADGHVPRPSLIHGDLWSGNWGTLSDGSWVIFDPAVSCSDAEAELAMMGLFGSPPEGFWPAYHARMPRAEGYAWRRDLYQLYHLLNHVVIFGHSYVDRSLASANAVLAAVRA